MSSSGLDPAHTHRTGGAFAKTNPKNYRGQECMPPNIGLGSLHNKDYRPWRLDVTALKRLSLQEYGEICDGHNGNDCCRGVVGGLWSHTIANRDGLIHLDRCAIQPSRPGITVGGYPVIILDVNRTLNGVTHHGAEPFSLSLSQSRLWRPEPGTRPNGR